jgi:hypothetical protein
MRKITERDAQSHKDLGSEYILAMHPSIKGHAIVIEGEGMTLGHVVGTLQRKGYVALGYASCGSPVEAVETFRAEGHYGHTFTNEGIVFSHYWNRTLDEI